MLKRHDVEFVCEKLTEPMTCQLCSTSLHELSLEQRHAHYEVHFTGDLHASGPSSLKSMSAPKLRAPRPAKDVSPLAKQNLFWTQAHSTAPPNNFTPGLIPTLKRALLKSHAKGFTTRAMLCHEGATYVTTEYWDAGWGCGYRNFLMACTALLSQTVQPLYFPLLDDPTPPGVRNLQLWIQDAWANGFDREGAEQLKHTLVGTRKWIGTAELYVAFISRGIPAQLVDFPGSKRGPEAVTEWVTNYFSPPVATKGQTNAFNALKGANPIISTERMPLILQHSGHSRTVVGVEVDKKGGTNFLVFDPSVRPFKALRRAALARHHSSSLPKGKSNLSSFPQRVVHQLSNKSNVKSLKRHASNQSLDDDGRDSKRICGGFPSLDDPVIVVDDIGSGDNNDDVHADIKDLDPMKIVNFFRINQNTLAKKDKYQILWFPLDPPLEEDERWVRRFVTSEQVL